MAEVGVESHSRSAYGGATEADTHLAANIVAVDGEIYDVLEGALISFTDQQSDFGGRNRTPLPHREAHVILALTDEQLGRLTEAAAVVPHEQRDAFLRAVAARLDGDEIDDGDLQRVIDGALDDLLMAIAS
jgi:hypothetical protein